MSNRQTHLHDAPHHGNAAPHPDHSGKAITILKVQPFEGVGVVVTSDGVDVDGRLDPQFSQEGDNVSPPLAWTAVQDAQTYALVMEDPDAPHDDPVLHWVMWDIPGGVTALPRGVPEGARPEMVVGATQGRNTHGGFGYMGPKPPKGDGAHRYYLQVFAVAKRLDMAPDTPLAELTNALKGATVASGQLVATFETPDDGVQG